LPRSSFLDTATGEVGQMMGSGLDAIVGTIMGKEWRKAIDYLMEMCDGVHCRL